MATTPERRRFPRVAIPPPLGGRPVGRQQMRLLDLSLGGARIAHLHPLPALQLCFLELSPGLGGAWLQGEVVWSQETGRQEGAAGEWVVSCQSGIRFTMLTLGQQAALAEALRILTAAQEG
jgi:hypothetical protein